MNLFIALVSLFISSVQLSQIDAGGFNGFYVKSADEPKNRVFVPKSDQHADFIVASITKFLDEFEDEIADIKTTEYDYGILKNDKNDENLPPVDLTMVEAGEEKVDLTANITKAPEVDTSYIIFDPDYYSFRPTSNTSTFIYLNLQTSPEYIENIRNL